MWWYVVSLRGWNRLIHRQGWKRGTDDNLHRTVGLAKTLKLLEWIREEISNEKQEPSAEAKKARKWRVEGGRPPWTRKEEPEPTSAVIVDDIIIAAVDAYTLSFYFFCVLTVLQHHRVTVNLRKSRFFPKRAEFVGVDVLPANRDKYVYLYGKYMTPRGEKRKSVRN